MSWSGAESRSHRAKKGRGGSSATSKSGADRLFAEISSRPTPDLPDAWKRAREIADKYRGVYEEGGERAMYYAMPEDDLHFLAFEAPYGTDLYVRAYLDGDPIDYEYAVRYGDVPESGQSTNWANGDSERGVSVSHLVHSASDLTRRTIYDVTLGGQGIDKYLVGGWDIGYTGSDGEPLLLDVEKIRKL